MRHDELVRLGARLPNQLQAAVRGGSPAWQPFGADEFVRRVAERMGLEPQAAWTHVRAVLGTLCSQEARRVLSRLGSSL